MKITRNSLRNITKEGSEMSSEIVVALISAFGAVFVGILSFVGVVLTNKKASQEMQHKLETAQAVTDTKIEELTREVREHNNFARRMPVVEEQMKVANHRIEDLEHEMHEVEHEVHELERR